MRRRALVVALLALLVCGAPALAQIDMDDEDEALNSVNAQIEAAIGTWAERLLPYAQRLFLLLATLELIWTLYSAAFRHQQGPTEVLTIFFKRLLVLLILWNVLAALAPGPGASGALAMLPGLRDLGIDITGLPNLNPLVLFDKGIQLIKEWGRVIEQNLGFWDMLRLSWTMYLSLVLFIVMVAAYVLVIAVAVLVLAQAAMAIGVGFVLMAFSGSRFTIHIAEAFPTMLVRIAMKVITLYALIALGIGLLDLWIDQVQEILLTGTVVGWLDLMAAQTGALWAYAALVATAPRAIDKYIGEMGRFNLDRLFNAGQA